MTISRTHRTILASCLGTMVALTAVGSGARLADAIAHQGPRTVYLPMSPVGPTCVSQTGVVVPCPSDTRTELQELSDALAEMTR